MQTALSTLLLVLVVPPHYPYANICNNCFMWNELNLNLIPHMCPLHPYLISRQWNTKQHVCLAIYKCKEPVCRFRIPAFRGTVFLLKLFIWIPVIHWDILSNMFFTVHLCSAVTFTLCSSHSDDCFLSFIAEQSLKKQDVVHITKVSPFPTGMAAW